MMYVLCVYVPYFGVWCVIFVVLHVRITFYLQLLTLVLCFDVQNSVYFGFANRASRHSRNLYSTTRLVYSPTHKLVISGGVLLGQATNNIVKYHIVITLLVEASSFGICHIIICLGSQLMVSQLNHVYSICNPMLLCLIEE